MRNENSGVQPVWLCEMPTELLLIFWMRDGVAFPEKSIARSGEIAEGKQIARKRTCRSNEYEKKNGPGAFASAS
jgi:hypothetical protein